MSSLRKRGVRLPPMETEDGLTARDIMDKIRSFYVRFERSRNKEISEFAESYFLELLHEYPKSMCSRHLTESMQLLIALYYFDSKPSPEEKDPLWNGFSYEDLSIIFDRSKATIHEAIIRKEAEAKQLLEEVIFQRDHSIVVYHSSFDKINYHNR
ncbi:hypothetical protein J7K27_02625 [Candidatus Bathyarchaeota archaeon]|nr:hypothetical protein [Candidatus Bathyarchaeota archaeon]